MEIGEHCTLKSCASLTFLPIACPYCRSSFCQSHFLPLQHACQAPGAAEADRTLSDSEILKRIQRANTRRKQVQGSTHDAQSSSSSGSLDVSEPPNRLPCQLKGCKRFSLQMDNPQQDIHASANIKPNTTLQDGSHGRRTFTHVAPRCDRCHGFFCMPYVRDPPQTALLTCLL